MTHQANYARDRIALYMLRGLVDFVEAHTNLELASGRPDELVQKLFPEGSQKVAPRVQP